MSQSKRAPNRRRLTDQYIRKLTPPSDKSFMVWDTAQGGLALRVRPTGTKTFKCCYPHQGRLTATSFDDQPGATVRLGRQTFPALVLGKDLPFFRCQVQAKQRRQECAPR
ncbi:MAG: hypothetical protein O7B24_13995 [Alphaproteobacteria bacterium]|nr:hypothetical protein [Alphaproteobacteria bacterium]